MRINTTPIMAGVILAFLTSLTSANTPTCRGEGFLASFRTPDAALSVTVSGTIAYVADRLSGLQIIDVSDPESPVFLGSYDTPNQALDVKVVGATAYVADLDGLLIIDVSNPQSPFLQSTVSIPATQSVAIDGTIAYIAASENGLQIIDVSNPEAPVILGSTNIPNQDAQDVEVVGNTAYMASQDDGVHIIDVADPASPVLMGTYNTGGVIDDISVVDSSLYIIDQDFGVYLIDASDPKNLVVLGSYEMPGSATDIKNTGSTAYVSAGLNGLQVIDFSNPTTPVLIGTSNTPNFAHAVSVLDGIAYVADEFSGLQILDVSSPEIEPSINTGSFDIDTLGFARRVEIVGTTAYVAGISKLLILDISNPKSPQLLSTVPVRVFGLTVEDSIAYVVEGRELTLIDISNPRSPEILGTLNLNPSALTAFFLDVEVFNQTAYVVGSSGNFIWVDVSDPLVPFQIVRSSRWAAYRIRVQGNFAYLVGPGGLTIYDISGTLPNFIARFGQSGNVVDIDIANEIVYIVNSTSGLLISLDVSNPQSPLILSVYKMPSGATGVSISGTSAYVSLSDGGIQIIDITNPENLRPIGSYELPPSTSVKVLGTTACVTVGDDGLVVLDLPDCFNCKADINPDGSLDFFDVAAFLTLFSNQESVSDLNNDGQYDFFDISAFLTAYAAGCL